MGETERGKASGIAQHQEENQPPKYCSQNVWKNRSSQTGKNEIAQWSEYWQIAIKSFLKFFFSRNKKKTEYIYLNTNKFLPQLPFNFLTVHSRGNSRQRVQSPKKQRDQLFFCFISRQTIHHSPAAVQFQFLVETFQTSFFFFLLQVHGDDAH